MTSPFFLLWPTVRLLMLITELPAQEFVPLVLTVAGVLCKLLCFLICFLCVT